ncbi:hypothetical protein T492DRAFT_1127219 [Pavlovales sp. CCMP2436]|nr:hypothetical protein T492DRAFT_1127219 [Pavlovales sp. CCMP2436]
MAAPPTAAGDFPRGGGSVLTPIEYRQAAHAAPDADDPKHKKRERVDGAEAKPSRKKAPVSAEPKKKGGGRPAAPESLGAWTTSQAPHRVDPLTLKPGALVVAKVNRPTAGGLLVSALEFFAATVELLQLPEAPGTSEWAEAPQCAPGFKLRARTIALSARPELVKLAAHSAEGEAAVGARVEVSVVAAVPKLGLLARATLEVDVLFTSLSVSLSLFLLYFFSFL